MHFAVKKQDRDLSGSHSSWPQEAEGTECSSPGTVLDICQPFIFTVVTEGLDLGGKKLTFVYFHRKQGSLFMFSGSAVLTKHSGTDLSLAWTKGVRSLSVVMGQRALGSPDQVSQF